MLSWEFPPRIIGGISSHVNDLSLALARRGVSVHVVTCDFPGAPDYERIDGVHVYRFNSRVPSYSFLQWVFMMNHAMAEKAIDVINACNENVDIIHAHDWLVANAATRVASAFGKSLVTTIHATELGRRGGIHDDYQRTIHEVEKQLIDQSSRVICCSNYMAGQISEAFGVGAPKLHMIPNGVNTGKFDAPMDTSLVRKLYSRHEEKIVLFVGRLVHEKGVHVLLGAAPKILNEMAKVNFVIVGEGGMHEYLRKEAWDFGVSDHVFFTGFVDCRALIKLYRASDVAVFPSLYEPFGITALEAMAAGTPVVVADTGGLGEIVEHEKTGIKVYADNSDSLAWGILQVLQNPRQASELRTNAHEKVVKDYDWNKIAQQTLGVYSEALRAGPAPVLRVNLGSAFSKFKEYSEDMKILVLLHVLGAVNAEHAMVMRELADILGMRYARLRALLTALAIAGYVDSYIDNVRRVRYYLTKQGIIKACSLFS
jgi:glycosyltransferase involved in cell wall biosynthesis